MKHFKLYAKPLATLMLFMAALVYWWLIHPEIISYHEQNQMFLTTFDYFVAHTSLPGAVADYLAESIVQLGFIVFWGAVAMALLLTAIHLIVWRIMRLCGATSFSYLLSMLPSLLIMTLATDTDVLPTFSVSFLIVAVAAWLRTVVCRLRYVWIVDAIALPAIYWIAGPLALVLLCAVVVNNIWCSCERRTSLPKAAIIALAFAIYEVAVIVITGMSLQYNYSALFCGLFYCASPNASPAPWLIVAGVSILLPIIVLIISNLKNKVVTFAISLVPIVVAIVLMALGSNRKQLEVVRYDYLVRASKWNAIIAQSEKRQPESIAGIAATNLALSLTGQMPDRMFEFRQAGAAGLLPSDDLTSLTSLISAEICWNLGMVNEAQRFFFEAQEAIAGYKSSVRCCRRLAETSLVNGDYNVAAKYLRWLANTTFYRSWAVSRLEMIAHKEQIEADAVYARQRSFRTRADYFFGDTSADQIFGNLYTHNNDNHAALEYLMAYEQVERDAAHFVQYFPLVLSAHPARIPRSYQESLAIFTLKDKNTKMKRWIDQNTLQLLDSFMQICSRDVHSPQLDQSPFATTYWHYLLNDEYPSQRDNTGAPATTSQLLESTYTTSNLSL